MAEIAIRLPEDLAREAREAGLLAPEQLERLLRAEMRRRKVERLFEAMDCMTAADETPEMPLEEIAEVVRTMRRQRRAQVSI